jgi:hypothetical protein
MFQDEATLSEARDARVEAFSDPMRELNRLTGSIRAKCDQPSSRSMTTNEETDTGKGL